MGLEEKWITHLRCEKYFCRVTYWAPVELLLQWVLVDWQQYWQECTTKNGKESSEVKQSNHEACDLYHTDHLMLSHGAHLQIRVSIAWVCHSLLPGWRKQQNSGGYAQTQWMWYPLNLLKTFAWTCTQGAWVRFVTERCICNISNVNSQCSCIHSPNKDLGVEKGGFLELRVLFLSISSLLSILSMTHHYQKFCTTNLARSSATNMSSYIHIW